MSASSDRYQPDTDCRFGAGAATRFTPHLGNKSNSLNRFERNPMPQTQLQYTESMIQKIARKSMMTLEYQEIMDSLFEQHVSRGAR